MANLPANVEPIKISYKYPDGRVFSVEGKELENLRKNERKIVNAFDMHRCTGTPEFEPVDWIVDYPAHDPRP